MKCLKKDPIKYSQYRAACAAACRDTLLVRASICHVVVAGAGRGLLVTAALEAWHAHVQAMTATNATGTTATVTPMTLRCTTVEKNPSAVHYLCAMAAHDPLWLHYPVDVLQANIRQLGATAAAALCPDVNIVILALLGSFWLQ